MSSDHDFPNTRWSVVLEAGDPDSALRHQALERICRTYWLPIYAYARAQKLSPADAEDLTQIVLADLLEKEAFEKVTEGKGRLRSFLMAVTKNRMRKEWRDANRKKRGGGKQILSLDWETAEQRCSIDPIDDESPENLFDRNWGADLLRRTMDRLEAVYVAEGKAEVFAALRDVIGQARGEADYGELAAGLGISEGAARVATHRLRKRYRRLLKEEIALTLDDGSEEAVEDEIRYLFGVFAR
jgi:RNA polymerase sigma-70 factor (ECF subfamily)